MIASNFPGGILLCFSPLTKYELLLPQLAIQVVGDFTMLLGSSLPVKRAGSIFPVFEYRCTEQSVYEGFMTVFLKNSNFVLNDP